MIISDNTTPPAKPGQGWMVAVLLVLIGAVTIGLTMLTANINPPAPGQTKAVAPASPNYSAVREANFQR